MTENVSIHVKYLIMPANFTVVEMEETLIVGKKLPIILGRPFMAIASTMIDVQNETLTITVFGQTMEFKVF